MSSIIPLSVALISRKKAVLNIGVIVLITRSISLVLQAANAAGASSAEVGSWLFALGFCMTISCIGFSLYYRLPILIGWSTPGAAFWGLIAGVLVSIVLNYKKRELVMEGITLTK